MKHIALLIFFTCTLPLRNYAQNEFRTFTQQNGQQLVAKATDLDMSKKRILIEDTNGRANWMKPSGFIPTDQAFFKSWISLNRFLCDQSLSIKITEKKESSTASRYNLIFHNHSTRAFQDLLIEYRLYIKEISYTGGNNIINFEEGCLLIKNLNPSEKESLATHLVNTGTNYETGFEKNTEYTYSGASHTTLTPKSKKVGKKQLLGIWIKISNRKGHDLNAIREQSLPSSLMREHKWIHYATKSEQIKENPYAIPKNISSISEKKDERSVSRKAQIKIDIFENFAKKGSPKAYCSIGAIFEKGKLTPRDLPKALQYYEKSFAEGWTKAACDAGKLFLKGGRGLKRDEAKALEWFEQGNALNDMACLCELARYYGANKNKNRRDGPKAAAYADRMMAQKKITDIEFSPVAAAAYAQNGDFNKAVAMQQEIIEYVNNKYAKKKYEEFRHSFKKQLQRYQQELTFSADE